ncbi:hypothetical protein [Nocardia seriolae]|uniref:Uncharacterized protein n=1 Tax=Nocardia seriolae TaxID=37332 RepID=A0A0B8N912_9NOCA|nr:hypothetical protein [Nocardia seriolae]MTJ63412.1 hypothetical protein [Nocardia seriolae]MTJ70187.1 hypothetical protein [Nocardia seriolae]MTJ88786.1 hypothetical protein [Nocardia seriolae]MTK32766.1 hypothetical protein [Nocardia seriolae]MTK41312.1 hypothetical protein [Nocardia seriolae]
MQVWNPAYLGGNTGYSRGVAIDWHYRFAYLLGVAGVDIDDVVDALLDWLAGQQRVWLRSTDSQYVVMWMRTASGSPVEILARIAGSDLYLVAGRALSGDRLNEFEKWEDTDE